MAPGPSSSPLPFASGSSHASDPLANSSAVSTSPTGDQSHSAHVDHKHCATCGQQLESVIGPESDSGSAQTSRILSVGSHAFVVRSMQSTSSTNTAPESDATSQAQYTVDEEGRPLCHACGDVLRTRLSNQSEDHSMAIDTDGHPDASTAAASSFDTNTPISISIGGSSAMAPHTSSVLQSSTPAPPHDGGMTESAPHLARSSSFSRSQAVHNVSENGDDPMSLPLATSAAASRPIVSVPSTRSISPLASTSNHRPVTSEPRSSSSAISSITPRIGPSSMTRPRLSNMPASTHRSQSPSASRVLTSHLEMMHRSMSPFKHDSDTNRPLSAPVWFDPTRADPFADVTRLRVPPRGKGCLYPGAIFRGTQKSGKLSYDVSVEILNVDIRSSHLDGYLNIRGLTEDWPELTTFFTAEIIGIDHDFITGRWGAQEADDMKHWSRFSPFKALHRSLSPGTGRFNHLNRPYVFMRWKERFLVPDWKVRDISGASFAGFYYVCAEFGDMSEWLTGSVDPQKTQFGQSAAATGTAVAQEARATSSANGSPMPDSRSSSPRSMTRRRLGSQNMQGIARNEVYDIDERSSRAVLTAFDRQVSTTASLLRTIRGVQAERRTRDSPTSNARTEDRSMSPSAEVYRGASLLSSHRLRAGLQTQTTSPRVDDAPEDAMEQDVQQPAEPAPAPAPAHEDDLNTTATPSPGKITAFYYHENSEPYQQLDLLHVPQRCIGAFEMR